MITINDVQIVPTIFSDKTSQVWKLIREEEALRAPVIA